MIEDFANASAADGIYIRRGTQLVLIPLSPEGEPQPGDLETSGIEAQEGVILAMTTLERGILSLLPPQVRDVAMRVAREQAGILAQIQAATPATKPGT